MLRQKIILLVGLLVILVLFFWMQNIGDQPVILVRGFTMLVTTGLDLLTVAALVIVSGGLGRTARQRWKFHDLNTAEAVALDSGLGLGIISLGALVFGLLGLFNVVMWLMLIVIAVVVRQGLVRWLQALHSLIATACQPQTGWERFVMIVVAVMLGLALLLALAPPFGWDAMTYHLVGAQRYADAGRITTHPDIHFLGFPQGMEVLYGLLLTSFGRETSTTPLHWYYGVLALIGIAGLIRRYANRSAAFTSMLLVLSSYSLWLLFGVSYVDLGVMLYGALALIAVMRWRTTSTENWLILTGILAGLALGVKYTAGLYIIALGVVILIHQPRNVIRHGLLFGVGVLIMFAPWLLKGGLLYGNPIYPYVFGGVSWDALRNADFSSVGNGLLAGTNAWHLLVLPLTATIFGHEKYAPYNFTLGMWLFTLPFVVLLGWRRLPNQARPLAKTAGWLALILLALWMLMAANTGIGAQPRLLLVGFPVVVVLGTLGLYSLEHWPTKPLNMNFLVRILLSFTVLLTGFNVIYEFTHANLPRYFVQRDVDGYLRDNLGNYYSALQHLESLPAGSTVLFMWEPKSFYCPQHITCVPDVLFDHWWRPLRQENSPDTIMQQWQAAEVDFMLVAGLNADSGTGFDFALNENAAVQVELEQFPAALEAYLEPVWTDGIYTLYRWQASS